MSMAMFQQNSAYKDRLPAGSKLFLAWHTEISEVSPYERNVISQTVTP